MIFRRKKQAPASSSASATEAPSPASDRTELGPGWRFKGRIYGKGRITLQGTVEGELDLQGTIRVAAPGSIKGLLRAEEVHLSGGLEGEVEGRRLVTIEETARLNGDVSTPRLQMAAGALLNGHVDMQGPRNPLRRTMP